MITEPLPITTPAHGAGMPVATHCPYCAFQCGITLTPRDGRLELAGDAAFPVNRGALCVKGWHAVATLDHPDRLRSPLVRNAAGQLEPAAWEEALGRTAAAFQAAARESGPDAVGVFGGGSLTNEKAYLLGKFARVALGTAQIDYNGRFCMSSAAAAGLRSFGIDRGLPFPVSDIAGTDLIFLVGGNPAETMPPLMQYFVEQRERGGRLIVADPRRSATALGATLHLRLRPGTDAALVNGLLHLLVRDGHTDLDYIARRTEGFEAVRSAVASYWPERVERITGVPEALLLEAARLLGEAPTAMVLTARGAEQQAQGVANTLACINLALARGLVGRPFSGFGTLTGQGNGQGGREHGQKADQLPGYRRIDDPAARRHMAGVWGIPEAAIPGPGRSAYELLDAAGRPGGVRAMLVMGSNPVVSAPNAINVSERLASLDFLAVADYFLSETAALAHVVFPSAQWAEEDGTMTNLEGRVLLRRRAQQPPPGVRTDLDLLGGLAAALGKGKHFSFAGAEAVFEELRLATAGGVADYSGITYRRLAAEQGVAWPCPAGAPEGTPRLFATSFPTPSGRARFFAVHHRAPAEETDAEFPLVLTTGRVLAQYQSGTQTRRVAALNELAADPQAEFHPATAQRFGLEPGTLVELRSRRGAAVARVKLTAGIRENTVFMAFHWGGRQAVNRLTNPALDPVSRMPEFKVCAVAARPLPPEEGVA